MRIIIEEDRERGVDPDACIECARCGKPRPLIGSIRYDDTIRLCSSCATLYEVARLNGTVRSCAAFVGKAPAGAH